MATPGSPFLPSGEGVEPPELGFHPGVLLGRDGRIPGAAGFPAGGRTVTSDVTRRPMQCNSFVEAYTDFRDGLLSPAREAEFEAHLQACPACRRYDRVIHDGVDLLSELPAPQASDDFMPRLQHRIYNLDQGVLDASSHRFLGSAALVAVASVGLLALFWLPFAASVPIEVELPAVAAERPPEQLVTFDRQVPSLLRSGPFVEPVSLLDEHSQKSFLDGQRSWYSAPQQGPRVFLNADLR